VVSHVPAPVEAGVHEGRSANLPDAESYKQVGSILLNMKPVEAAKIVSYLNDDQVEGLLRSMSPRQAAGVLGQLPAERAAALSRRLLVPSKEARP
jgi:flagellar motility protein MotE (MotC chaperone)